MIETLVVGSDGSEHAQHAVEFAAQLAKQLNAEVVLVDVTPPYPLGVKHFGNLAYVPEDALNEARAAHETRVRTEFAAPLAQAGVKWQVRVLEGTASEVIVAVATEVNAQLIVVGARGLHGLSELLHGSTSQDLTHRATVPVLVVPSAD